MAFHCFGFTKSTPPIHLCPLVTYCCSNSGSIKCSNHGFNLHSVENKKNDRLPLDLLVNKRKVITISMVTLLFNGALSRFSSKATAELLELERYTDLNEGFTLLRPTYWIKVDKAGATVLFQDVNNGSNNAGVVVSPVRISKLDDFGSPQFVADKLIEAEKRKESTKDAEVVAVAERSGHGGLQVYEFEYKLDSTRGGMKRVFSAAFVASKKLYLLNISHSDGLENPLDSHTRMMLDQVLRSFDVSSMT